MPTPPHTRPAAVIALSIVALLAASAGLRLSLTSPLSIVDAVPTVSAESSTERGEPAPVKVRRPRPTDALPMSLLPAAAALVGVAALAATGARRVVDVTTAPPGALLVARHTRRRAPPRS